MSLGIVLFLVGIYIVPLILLAWGHKIRRLSPRSRRAFWGAIIGHCIAGVLAVTLGMIPPESWTAEETARGFIGLWSLVVFPAIGAIGSLVMPSNRS